VTSPAVFEEIKDQPFSSFIVACLVFAAVNVTLLLCGGHNKAEALKNIRAAVTPEPIDKTFIAWTTKDWLGRTIVPAVVLMGSSQMAAATFDSEAQYLHQTIDCVQHRDIQILAESISAEAGYPVQVFNWSQSGAMISDDYLIASNLFKDPLKPAIVILGISPRDFIDNTLPCAGSTETFRFFAHYDDLEPYASKAFPDFMSRLAWIIDSLPLQQFKQELRIVLRNLGHELIYQKDSVFKDDDLTRVQPGKWQVSPEMPTFSDNTVEYLRRYKNPFPPMYQLQQSFFEKFLSLMHDRSISVMVVGMPSLPMNRALLPKDFWNRWRSYVAVQCNRYGDRWLDLSGSDNCKDDYLDTVHLNATGGKKLMGALLNNYGFNKI
jgi:hypothetical protein